MSRIPTAERLGLADQIRPVESFADKVAMIGKSTPNPVAALIALHYENVALSNRLAVLVGRGGNSVLIDEAVLAIQRWNRLLREASVFVTDENIQSLSSNSRDESS